MSYPVVFNEPEYTYIAEKGVQENDLSAYQSCEVIRMVNMDSRSPMGVQASPCCPGCDEGGQEWCDDLLEALYVGAVEKEDGTMEDGAALMLEACERLGLQAYGVTFEPDFAVSFLLDSADDLADFFHTVGDMVYVGLPAYAHHAARAEVALLNGEMWRAGRIETEDYVEGMGVDDCPEIIAHGWIWDDVDAIGVSYPTRDEVLNLR